MHSKAQSTRWFIQWGLQVLFAAALSIAALPSFALNPSHSLAQYQHTAWSERDGAPTNVRGIAQTPDGYLWLANPKGLWRFDGFAFEQVRSLGGKSLENDSISTIFNGPQGELLLAFRVGAAVFSEGRLTRLPKCVLTSGSVTVEGETWLVCNGKPVRLLNDHTSVLPDDWKYPDLPTTSMRKDANGAVWAMTREQLLVLDKGASSFKSYPRKVSGIDALAPDGSLWTSNADGLSRTSFAQGVPVETVKATPEVYTLLHFDRDGGLWVAGAKGLAHFGDARRLTSAWLSPSSAAVARSPQSGPTSPVVSTIFEDGRGSIWLGTPSGLERFRDNFFNPIKLPGNSAFSIAAGDNGEIWAANFLGKLTKVTDSSITEFDEISGGITALSRDRNGTVWVAAANGKIWKINHGKISASTDVPAVIHGSGVTSVTTDLSGSLWVGSYINGVVGQYVGGRWTTPSGNNGLPGRWSSRNLLADSKGRIWASRRFNMTLLEDGKATDFGSAQGLAVGEISALSEKGARIWVGGLNGIAYFDGTRFQTLQSAGEGFFDVAGVLQTSNGDLWIHQYDAVFRVPAAELEKQAHEPAYKLKAERFDFWDGLYGTCPPSVARSNLIEASDGRIWLSTSEGVMVVDPKRPRPPASVPRVFVDKVVVDGVPHDLSVPMVLPRQTKSVRFIYTAASPARPERLQFRYRLDGVDTEWNEVGSRRATTYNTLASGSYAFRVASSDEAGAWAGNETVMTFRVDPFWYEAIVFRAACGVMAVVCLWAVFRWQLRRMTSRVHWQMRMQQAERERIARDLHDTLLQGVHGLTWRMQSIANSITRDNPVRERMEQALDTAELLLTESRRRLQILRERGSDPVMLSEAIRDVLVGAAAGHPCKYEFTCMGHEMRVKSSAQVDICDIVREGFVNAVIHASPQSIDVKLTYSPRGLTIAVTDDGIGLAPHIAKHGRPGHWGLSGMRERARELGGSIEIQSVAAGGTRVVFRLRARRAFATESQQGWKARLHIWRHRWGRKTDAV